jgi:hypothetical protein
VTRLPADLSLSLLRHPIEHSPPDSVHSLHFVKWSTEEIEPTHVEHLCPEFVIRAVGHNNQSGRIQYGCEAAENILPVTEQGKCGKVKCVIFRVEIRW